MNKEARIESQIRHFYANMPDVDDSFPLKEHLLKHEDSRMAWYLLGKSYEGKGDMSKATYCFAQAGDIYTAFEGKPAPSLAQYASPENDRRSTLGWGVVFTLLLVGIGFGLYALAEKYNKPPAEQQVMYGAPSVQAATASPSARGAYTMVSAATDPDAAGQKVLSDLLAANQLVGLLVEAPTLGEWQDWLKSGEPIAEVAQDRLNGTSQIKWFQADWCRCIPQERNAAEKKVALWKQAQEEKLVLRSAIIRYREKTGEWPQSPEALSGDYPNNWLSGWNPEMTGWFEELTEAEREGLGRTQDDDAKQVDVGWPDQADEGKYSGATPAGLYEQFKQEPLEIVVDKSQHRLAVVSGNIIVRSYQVGLGGERTPSGRMLITEKVKNPNGGQDVYGSRGMTLSEGQYGIHGTPKIGSIGKDESLGCVRMTNDDIEELYALVPLGTPVTFVDSGLPAEQRTPEERFQLSPMSNEENPEKMYQWLR